MRCCFSALNLLGGVLAIITMPSGCSHSPDFVPVGEESRGGGCNIAYWLILTPDDVTVFGIQSEIDYELILMLVHKGVILSGMRCTYIWLRRGRGERRGKESELANFYRCDKKKEGTTMQFPSGEQQKLATESPLVNKREDSGRPTA